MVRIGEGGRCVQAVLAAVCVKDGSLERIPLNLVERVSACDQAVGRRSLGH